MSTSVQMCGMTMLDRGSGIIFKLSSAVLNNLINIHGTVEAQRSV